MVILRSQTKITDFFMILAWACPFKHQDLQMFSYKLGKYEYFSPLEKSEHLNYLI